MVVVASVWESGWNTPIKEFDLWYYPLMDFGVDEFAMTPVSGARLNNKVQEFHSVEEIIEHYKLPVILCTEYGKSTLKEFAHPKDALYLFNRTSGGNIVENPEYSLKIETKLDKGMLWGHQSASIILYDRFIKNGNNNSR